MFSGDFKTWKKASRKCSGYDVSSIADKVLSAAIKVKRGEAAYERDSVLFYQADPPWRLLTAMLAATVREKRLSVLDFGGSLGSSYFQCLPHLAGLVDFSWAIVEQEHYVELGRKYLSDDKLSFYPDIESCLSEKAPNVVLSNSVLQYLESPEVFCDKLVRAGAETIVLDRIAMIERERHRLTKQEVDPSIYEASYPAWFFNEAQFLNWFGSDYELQFDWQCDDSYELQGDEVKFKGYLLRRSV